MAGVLGVDGAPGGWLLALVHRGRVRWRYTTDAAELATAAVEAVAVDIPIGLPEVGPRAADTAARGLLGPRRSSVFPAPVRAVLGAADYRDACARSKAAAGRALSRQTYHLLPRIAAVDAVITPALQRRIVEAHPELAFTRMTGHPLPTKRSPAGRDARLACLAGWLGLPPAPLTDVVATVPRPGRPDDALDALACAWVAARWRDGTATILPSPPAEERDRRGLRMQIVS